jgi:hypothetical protein
MRARHRVRQIVNAVNLSTLLGLLVAGIGRARPSRGPDGLMVARGYRLPVPAAVAFTIGNVVVLRISDERLARRPELLLHEGRHATQYAFCVGPVMLPLYFVAAGVSWVLSGDFASHNVFERLAGLDDGGYQRRPARAALTGRRRPAG